MRSDLVLKLYATAALTSIALAGLAEEAPDAFRKFPETTSVRRLDEVKAVKDLDVASLAD